MKPLWLLMLLALPLSVQAGNLRLAQPLVADNLTDGPSLPVSGANFLMAPAIRGQWQVATLLSDVPDTDASCKAFLDRVQKMAVTVGQGDNGGDVRRNTTAPNADIPNGVDTLYVHLPQAHVEEVWVCHGVTAPRDQQTWSRFTPSPLQPGQVSLITQAHAHFGVPLDG